MVAALKQSTRVAEEFADIIRKKDKQIDDYKAAGGTVSKRNMNNSSLFQFIVTNNRMMKQMC